MWAWILKELQKAVKALPFNKALVGVEKEDIVSLVALYLCQNQKMAKDIYEKKNIGLLYRLIKHEIFEQESKMCFNGTSAFSRYQRIIALCEKYDIEPIPENAYKISALLNNSFSDFTISGVVTLLSDGALKMRNARFYQENLNELKDI